MIFEVGFETSGALIAHDTYDNYTIFMIITISAIDTNQLNLICWKVRWKRVPQTSRIDSFRRFRRGVTPVDSWTFWRFSLTLGAVYISP